MKHILSLVAAALILVSCEHKTEVTGVKKFTLSDTIRHMMTIDSVRTCNIDDEVSLNGEISFNENNVVKVFPRSSGQVLQAPLTLGDYVHKGQVLAVIRSADVAGSYADLSSTNADIAITKRQMENAEALYKNGISSEREYVEAKQNYEKALAARNKVQSSISINGGGNSKAGGEYSVLAPIDGYIVEKKVNAGNFIRSDASENLFTISDLRNVWAYANVYESDISKVKEGFTVSVKAAAYPDKEFVGKIDKIGQVLDPQSKALRVRVTLDNSEKLLKPDMFARVIVSNKESRTATCIPTQAIVSQDGKQYVVTYFGKDSLDVAEIHVLRTVGDHTYLIDGVQPGQQVVTKEQLLIFNQLVEE